MYSYNEFDRNFVANRVDEFRDQVDRRLNGSLSEDEFRPLRLMNGLYLQLHAYMLRVAIPYGSLNSRQMNALADIADRWDKGYGHFTTRQNIQFNWPKLKDVPDILAALSKLNMHAIQTSGACIRSVTSDHFAGATDDELKDPRPTAELIRQWSTGHPEFAFLPRKFKFAVTGSQSDRAVTKMHDVGLRLVKNEDGNPGYEVSVGGGLGRTPMIGKIVRDFLPRHDLLPYLEAILQVYNEIGRRDNKYKARIKITAFETGFDTFKTKIENRFLRLRGLFDGVDQVHLKEIENRFVLPRFKSVSLSEYDTTRFTNPAFRSFCDTNLNTHKSPEYASVTVSLKKHGQTPGDATSAQMRALADIAFKFAHDDIRVSHEQNIVLPHVHKSDLPAVYAALRAADLATANVGLISDIISCPGMDYCDLATARSINIAQGIALRFKELKSEHDIGPLKLKISGCINACGHHHVGHIGILGLEKAGIESYQITLGGDGTEQAAIGKVIGPGFSAENIIPAVQTLIETYLDLRHSADESFIQAIRRLGTDPFKAALYPGKEARRAA